MDTTIPRSSSQVQARLFGTLTLLRGNKPLALPASSGARALLAYLLLYRQQPHPRAVLVGLLFPDLPEDRARRALTQALWHIRRTLPQVVAADADTIQIPPDAPVWVDVEEFEEQVNRYTGKQGDLSTCLPVYLSTAVELYRGDLLEGFYDNWVLAERERLRESYLQALECLIQLDKSAGRYPQALDSALKLTNADPLREAAHREVMRLYLLLHRPEAALKQFATCRQILNTELALEPEPETVALAQEIAHRSGTSAAPYLPETLLPAPITLDDARAGQIPMVGRADERTQLLARVEEILNGIGGLALVEGEAGVGKTRLLHEVARDAEWRGAQVLWGRCRELEAAAPYAPLLQAVSDGLTPLRAEQVRGLLAPVWLQVLAPLLPDLAAPLPPPVPLDPAQARTRLIESFARLLSAWAQVTPLVVMLEDLQWADRDTLEILPHLARRLSDQGVVIVGTYRGEEARAQPALWDQLQALDRSGLRTRVSLNRLDANATSELIRRCLGLAKAAPLFEKRLYRETDGNPLFVLETLHTLHDEGLLSRDASGEWRTPWDETISDYAEMPLAPAVERVIARRIAQLAPDFRGTLKAAAVLGSQFNFALLSHVLSRSNVILSRSPDPERSEGEGAGEGAIGDLETKTVLATLAELVRRRFLEETPQAYRFSHDKVRQVIYTEMDAAERRELHRRAGEALEKLHPDQVPALAHHFFASEMWDQAARYSQQAGDQAAAVYANREAADHYTRALEALGHLPESVIASHALSEAEGEAKQSPCGLGIASSQSFDSANAPLRMRLAMTDREILFELRAAREAVYALLGERSAQADDLQALEELLDDPALDTPARRVQVALRRAGYHELISDYPSALTAVAQAVHLARDAGDAAAEYHAHLCWGRVLRRRGEMSDAREHLKRAFTLAQTTGDLTAQAISLHNLGVIFRELGEFNLALDHYRRGLEACQQSGNQVTLAEIYNSLGNFYHKTADYPTALKYHKEALALWRVIGDRRNEAISLRNASLVYSDSGDHESARRMLEQAAELSHALGDRRVQGFVYVFLGEVLGRLGDWDAAQSAYTMALALRREVGLHALAIDALAGLARVASARGNHAQAVAYAEEVLAWLDQHGIAGVGDALRAYVGAYRALLAAGETARGLAALRTAHNLLMSQAATISDEERRRAFVHDISPGKHISNDYHALVELAGTRRVQVRLPRADAATGRARRNKEWIEITWTIAAPEDDAIADKACPEGSQRTARRQHRLRRLLEQAAAQNAAPTHSQLADALGVGLRTVGRDIAALRQRDANLPRPRGRVTGGRATSGGTCSTPTALGTQMAG